MKKLLAIFLVGSLAVGTVSSANAHAELIKSNPKAGSTLTVSPKYVELIFGEELTVFKEKEVNSISLVKVSGQKVKTSLAVVDGVRIRANLLEALKSGQYEVKYRVVSADGHILKSSYRFKVKL